MAATKVVADFSCPWNESTGKATCHQKPAPSDRVRDLLLAELLKLGLPASHKSEVFFRVLESPGSGWSLMSAVYSHEHDGKADLCEVVAVSEGSGELRTIRRLPIKTTDADVPDATTWEPLDITDVSGDGKIEFVLQTDAYEDHWLEVVAPDSNGGAFKTVFSGLGYYL
jgi:hypothetical protein